MSTTGLTDKDFARALGIKRIIRTVCPKCSTHYMLIRAGGSLCLNAVGTYDYCGGRVQIRRKGE